MVDPKFQILRPDRSVIVYDGMIVFPIRLLLREMRESVRIILRVLIRDEELHFVSGLFVQKKYQTSCAITYL